MEYIGSSSHREIGPSEIAKIAETAKESKIEFF